MMTTAKLLLLLRIILVAVRVCPLLGFSAASRDSAAFDPAAQVGAASGGRRPFETFSPPSSNFDQPPPHPVGNVLILDHVNLNHQRGRHDWLTAFYFDVLQCAADPRKNDNLLANKGTVWANVGPFQFHLPEGKPNAQVLEGIVTLVYPDLQPILDRSHSNDLKSKLQGSQFNVETRRGDQDVDELIVTDPWGTKFRIVRGGEHDKDDRGRQPGDVSEGLGMRDLTIYAPSGCNIPGIARFYDAVLGAPTLDVQSDRCVVSMGPRQTLTFQWHPERRTEVRHEDLRDNDGSSRDSAPGEKGTATTTIFPSNYGPHVSMYVADLPSTYERATQTGGVYVNPRFKRQAYTLDEAIDDCMFRCLNIVDPLEPDKVMLRLEHEVRSVVKRDGTMYRSCPFDAIPDVCIKETRAF